MKKEIKFTKRERYLLGIIISFLILSIGSTFNYIAVTSNQCKMPVLSAYKYETNTHFSFQEKNQVNNFYFTDIISLKYAKASIGDFFIIGGFLIILICCISLILKIKKDGKCQKRN